MTFRNGDSELGARLAELLHDSKREFRERRQHSRTFAQTVAQRYLTPARVGVWRFLASHQRERPAGRLAFAEANLLEQFFSTIN